MTTVGPARAVTASVDSAVDDPRDGLARLLAGVPADLAAAADAVVARASLLLGSPVTVGSWSEQGWSRLAGAGTGLAGLPVTGPARRTAVIEERGMVSVGDGSVALCWDPGLRIDRGTRSLLRQACAWLSLTAAANAAHDELAAAGAEAGAIREVVQQLLSVRDVDQVLPYRTT